MLIRNVGFKGKHKLADKWARDPHVVVGIPNKDIPVYIVKSESDDRSKTLHRNMLLPFSAIAGIPDTTEKPPEEPRPVTSANRGTNYDSDISDSSSSGDSVPRFVIPQRRGRLPVQRRENSNFPDSVDSSGRSSTVTPPGTLNAPVVDTHMDESVYNTPQPPRRSIRTRRPPDRYGDWVVAQQTVDRTIDNQIWYV